MKKKVEQPNIMTGYDDKGELVMYYWQKEPFTVRQGMGFSIPRRLWWNPIWRIKQWYWSKKTITLGEFKEKINAK